MSIRLETIQYNCAHKDFALGTGAPSTIQPREVGCCPQLVIQLTLSASSHWTPNSPQNTGSRGAQLLSANWMIEIKVI